MMLVLGVAVVSWALGKTQGEGGGPASAASAGDGTTGSSKTYTDSTPRPEYTRAPPPPPPREPTPPPEPGVKPESSSEPQTGPKADPKPKSTWQRSTPGTDAKSAWEKAREETRKREEERKRAAEIQRRRDELEKERQRQREKEKLEQLEREWKDKKSKEEEAAKKAEAEVKAQQAKDEVDKRLQREKERREREARETLLKAAKEAREAKEALEKTRKDDQERKEAEAKDTEEARKAEIRASVEAARSARASNVSSNKRPPPMPSARTERDDDAYTFRPYDRPKTNQKSSAGSVYSDESYAPSATTAKTTPPGSTRGPYTTKDPDKIIIKGVYSFNNAFTRTPISQLISGQGNVTDGLILRITTEGLFIDDDVRGIPQREWDVKAWTMKLAESIELQGHHILRSSVRDSEGKKYVFILSQTEGWKVAVGLQRLRKGSQVRSLGVAGMPMNEAKVLLESLGWV